MVRGLLRSPRAAEARSFLRLLQVLQRSAAGSSGTGRPRGTGDARGAAGGFSPGNSRGGRENESANGIGKPAAPMCAMRRPRAGSPVDRRRVRGLRRGGWGWIAPARPAAGLPKSRCRCPLPDPLTYSVPARWSGLARVGVRARVPVGKRRVTGWIVGLPDRPPAEFETQLRAIESVVDLEPVLPDDLMEIARFASSYYAAPIGEVLRNMIPGRLPGWGDARAELTNRGALHDCRDPKSQASATSAPGSRPPCPGDDLGGTGRGDPLRADRELAREWPNPAVRAR